VDAYIYARTRALSEQDWSDIRDRFLQLYPRWRETPEGLSPGP
jgi:hypothetical protein